MDRCGLVAGCWFLLGWLSGVGGVNVDFNAVSGSVVAVDVGHGRIGVAKRAAGIFRRRREVVTWNREGRRAVTVTSMAGQDLVGVNGLAVLVNVVGGHGRLRGWRDDWRGDGRDGFRRILGEVQGYCQWFGGKITG